MPMRTAGVRAPNGNITQQLLDDTDRLLGIDTRPAVTRSVKSSLTGNTAMGFAPIEVDGKVSESFMELPDSKNFSLGADLNLRTSGVTTSAAAPIAPEKEISPEAREMQKANQGRAALGVVDAVGGILNANAKYSQFQGETKFNIQMARYQAAEARAVGAQRALREKVKGTSRADDARMAAVAQGQSARGDLAETLASNEEVFAAQNAMIEEINGMREAFGYESKVRQMQSNVRQAKISRDMEIVNNLAKGGMSVLGAL